MTKACSTWLSIGRRRPAISATRAGAAGDRHADLAGADVAAAGLDAAHPAAFDPKAGDLAVLDHVDAAQVGGAGIAPGDGVVARGAGAALQQAAIDREAHVVEVEERRVADLVAVQQFGVDALQPDRVAAPREGVALAVGMEQVEQAALGHHRVVVEFLRQPLPELERVLVELGVAAQQVVRPDDGGVAPDVAAAEPALLDHRDIGDSVVLGEVVGGREAMPAAADDDVIGGLRLGFRQAASQSRSPLSALRRMAKAE